MGPFYPPLPIITAVILSIAEVWRMIALIRIYRLVEFGHRWIETSSRSVLYINTVINSIKFIIKVYMNFIILFFSYKLIKVLKLLLI